MKPVSFNLFGQRLTILPKIIISFLVVLIPIQTLSLMMNHSSVNKVQNEILQSSASNVHFYLSSLETEINRILRLEREYISSDGDFLKAGVIPDSMDDYERGQTILRIENKLSILKSSSPYIKDIRIYFPSLGRTIWTTSFSSTIPDDEIRVIAGKDKRTQSPFTFVNNRLILGMLYPTTGNDMMFMIEVELSIPLLQQSMAQMSGKKNAGSILLNEPEQWVIGDTKDESITQSIRQWVSGQQKRQTASGMDRIEMDHKMYLIYYEQSESLGLTLVHYVPEAEALGVLKQYQSWYWVITLVSILIVYIFSYGIFLLIHKPMRRLVNSLAQVGEGNLELRLQHRYNDEFQDVFQQFNTMVSRIGTLIGEVSEQQTRSQHAELKQLQSQINPHFLYNSLFILLTLIRQEDKDSAERLVLHMGNYFRYITRTGEDEVSLENEMMHTQAYAGIQSLRFPDIQIRWGEIPEACRIVRVPRLILQPLVENAYLHGLEKMEGPGLLLIEVEHHENLLMIRVEDNSGHLNPEMIEELNHRLHTIAYSGETTGMFNVHRRLQLRYGQAYGLELAIGHSGGLCVTLRIPL
ncbi:hypothetical protein A3844_10550 [Paenibacillus helianthi]|uniref:HAMP domain-containing protein n=1 Tax=Paenibacillus helianthi TaxID=1349432 RepID=A0ABX3ES18_9BACL|nr:histidine kinase [Paenibacillus helianthi]OKP87497.1 hypothetical protein A3844_10550 [Paenibacillus helianthi]